MRANCTSGAVRGTSGNRRPYRSGPIHYGDFYMSEESLDPRAEVLIQRYLREWSDRVIKIAGVVFALVATLGGYSLYSVAQSTTTNVVQAKLASVTVQEQELFRALAATRAKHEEASRVGEEAQKQADKLSEYEQMVCSQACKTQRKFSSQSDRSQRLIPTL